MFDVFDVAVFLLTGFVVLHMCVLGYAGCSYNCCCLGHAVPLLLLLSPC